ncbi:MAG: N-6 DNA methylase [Candidatus Aminicenantes bacterium]|nr:N-6 DNA methylase [Candidatus Aminicenantes bacterium]
MNSLPDIYEQLGLNKENGLFDFADPAWKGKFSQKLEYALEKIKPDAFFCFNNEPLILFFDNPDNEKIIHQQCWNFNKAPVIFINTKSRLKIFNGFSFDSGRGLLHKLADGTDYRQFSYWRIVSGQLWREYEKEFSKKKRLDYKLLENIEAAREILIKKQSLNSSHANKLIGRLIFTRYLIDRKIRIGKNSSNGLLTNDDFLALLRDKDALYDFFDSLNQKFKGDLFPMNGEKNDVSPENLAVLYRLFKGEKIKSGQLSLFDIYNFDIIPIEFISSIYEYFIGKDKQEKNKSFYTPPFLVDYILNQAVMPHLEKETGPISCKVLDPSCGSGIFLVETLRLIILRFKELNPHLKPSQNEFKQAINRLLVENIYGIDKDKDALEVAIFSLYITLLDFFEEPKDINGFEFPNLLGRNFIEADFFDTTHSFNEKFAASKDSAHFDFIIGNPPWGKVNSPYMKYIETREKKESRKIKVSDKQIAQAFLVRVSDFCGPHTKCSMIITSKILYNLQADTFRSYFIENFFIDEVLEISSVRTQIFVRAVGPAAIITFRYAGVESTENNNVEHIALKPNPMFSLFKSILIEKYDYKEIRQGLFKEYDWLWKVSVYGSVLDFYFIKRLQSHKIFPVTIKTTLDQKENKLIYGEGIQRSGAAGDKNDASHLIGKSFLDTDKKDLVRYHVRVREESIWKNLTAHRPKKQKQDLFKAPALLVKSGLENDFKLVASISDRDVVYTHSIFGIKSLSGRLLLEILLGLINSSLMTYFLFIKGTSTGIEREQIISRELYPFPVVLHDQIAEKVQALLHLYKKSYGEDIDHFKLGRYEEEIKEAENELNELIFKLYKVSETEKDLMNYAFEISIPVLQDKTNKKPFSSLSKEELEDYARLFIEHFSRSYNSVETGYFQAEIYRATHIAAINFKVTPQPPPQAISWKNDLPGEQIIERMAGLAFQKVSSKLFIQKDIKGINKDSFYVIKPNQYKHWHRALARLDIIEFENSMLESQISREPDE